MSGWIVVAAVVLVQGGMLGWMLRVMYRRQTAQLAIVAVAVHEVLDKVTELDAELHAVADEPK